jgi:hypothetical protein
LFELSKKGRYPGILSELAESFGMMMVKVEAREFHLKEAIEKQRQVKDKLRSNSDEVLEA